jgi:predicted O-methyltransferase YrrM
MLALDDRCFPADRRFERHAAVTDGFEAALDAIADVPGWLSEDQARKLFDCAQAVPGGGTIVEIGSYRGRSAIVLARGATEGVRVIAIDPHAGNDRGPRQWESPSSEGEADSRALHENLARAGVLEQVEHLRLASLDALDAVSGAIDLLYVDGAHRYEPARADIARYGARVPAGGTMLIHDSFASVGVTLAILRSLVFGGQFVYVGRARSLTHYRRAATPLRPAERVRNAAAQLAQLPWFARNLAIKLAIVARQDRIARALGHRPGDEWPY